jgi:16S rRNA U516 pseudouridylate synthase RsuA-like enzyme
MDEGTFNMEVRKFLKKVGVTSQREIEKYVDEAIKSGSLKGNEVLMAQITLKVSDIQLSTTIDGTIRLE